MQIKMKLNSKNMIILLFSLISIANIQSFKSESNSKSNLHSENKAEVNAYINMFNLMNAKHKSKSKDDYMDLVNILSYTPSKSKKFNQRKSKDLFSFKENNKNSTNSTIKQTYKPYEEIKVLEKNQGDIWIDWWTIKSSEFKNSEFLPPVKISNGTNLKIRSNDKSMRLNDAFNCEDCSKPPSIFAFWMRLDETKLFYSATKTDLNILSSFSLDGLKDVTELESQIDGKKSYCMNLKNPLIQKEWEICNCNKKTVKQWVCRIKKMIGTADENCDSKKIEEETKEDKIDGPKKEKEEVIEPELIIPMPSRMCNENWNYLKQGSDWECICKSGKEQSPIDLPDYTAAIDSPAKPYFEYEKVGPNSHVSTLDGHLDANEPLMLRYRNYLSIHALLGKVVTLDGAVYRAEEIAIFTPSNHRIAGKQYDLEISIIHYGISKGDIAKQVVVSFLFKKKAGIYNQFIDDLDFYNLPNPKTKQVELTKNIYIPKIFFNYEGENDTQVIRMKPFSFYTYQGSLPFPPCTERTIHFVASEPIPIGSTAVRLFQEALRMPDEMEEVNGKMNINVDDWIPSSNRNVQPINGRPVFFWDHKKNCPESEKSDNNEVKPLGHYEKMKKEIVDYIFVDGDKPSGLPGALVVPNEEALGKK